MRRAKTHWEVGHLATEAETGETESMIRIARGHLLGRGKGGFFLGFQRECVPANFAFGLLEFETVREQIPLISHPVCRICYDSPGKPFQPATSSLRGQLSFAHCGHESHSL
jgi:hypothetical protein